MSNWKRSKYQRASKNIKEQTCKHRTKPFWQCFLTFFRIFHCWVLSAGWWWWWWWWWWWLLIITLRRILWHLDSRSLCPKNPDPSKSSRIDGHNPIPGSWHYIIGEIPFLGHIWILGDGSNVSHWNTIGTDEFPGNLPISPFEAWKIWVSGFPVRYGTGH